MEHLLILDIETVPVVSSYSSLSPEWQNLWDTKIAKTMPTNLTPEENYHQRAGILAEFGKIICISTGLFYHDKGKRLCFKIKSLFGDDEQKILKEFTQLVENYSKLHKNFQFAGHNIKEFDIPFICRRMIINNIALPKYLQLNGMKPWETNMVDTFHLWRFGDYKNYTSLKLLTAALGIAGSKNDMDGSMVQQVYYEEKNIERIVQYCQQDVKAVAQILLRLNNEPTLPDENIFFAKD